MFDRQSSQVLVKIIESTCMCFLSHKISLNAGHRTTTRMMRLFAAIVSMLMKPGLNPRRGLGLHASEPRLS